MKTIGAKELRQQLDKVFDRVLSGEDVIVNHRLKGPVRISAVHVPAADTAKRLAGLEAFDAAPKRPSPFDSSQPLKELYKESIAKKYAK